MFLQPGEWEMVKQDFTAMLNGLDAVDVILRWKEGGGSADPVYGDRTGEVESTLSTRAMIVFPVGGMLMYQARDLKKQRFGDVQANDAIFIIHATTPLEGKRDLKLEVENMGVYVPITNPPLNLAQYALMFPNGDQVVQWVYARIEKA